MRGDLVMSPDAPDAIRCTHVLAAGPLRCVLPASVVHSHVYVSGSFVPDRHTGSEGVQ